MAPQHSHIGTLSSASPRQDAEWDESLSVMLEQERTSYACGDYLGQPQAGPRPRGSKKDHQDHQASKIAPHDRTRIVDWCYAIVDLCHFDRDFVACAMNAVDRFMSTPSSRQDALLHHRGEYQLLAVTALYVSIKTHERIKVGSEDFSLASHGTYTTEDIESMELEMLHGLGWRMCPPTALQVGHRVLNLMESSTRGAGQAAFGMFDLLRDEVAYQSENAVRGYALSIQRPSTVSIASILNAIEQVSDDAEYEQLMKALVQRIVREYDFDSLQVIEETRDRLRSLVEGVDEQQADVEDVPQEVTVSLDEDDEPEEIQDLHGQSYCSVEAIPASSFVGDNMDSDDSCATVHPKS